MTERRAKTQGWLTVLAVTLLLLAFRMLWVPESREIGVDAYFHITMGRVLPDIWHQGTFPWTQLSIWRDCFYDKELGYHIILHVLSRWHALLPGPQSPPYHGAFLVVVAALIAVLHDSMRRLSPGRHNLWIVLFPCLSSYFLFRLLMLRPHNLSIILFLLVCGLLFDKRQSPRLRWQLLGLGFVYSYSYSNPHFILVPVAARVVVSFARERRNELGLCGWAIGGVLAGLTLHPQFPNTFGLWWVQCVQVVQAILTREESVELGREMLRPGLRVMWNECPLFLMFALHTAVVVKHRAHRQNSRLSAATCSLYLIEALGTVGFFVSRRAIEFAVPAATMASALMWHNLDGNALLCRWNRGMRPIFLHALLAAVVTTYAVTNLFRHFGPDRCTEEYSQVAEWLPRTLPAGTVIANINWSDFPMLFHAAPDYRFLVALDPYFGAAYDADRMKRIERFRSTDSVMGPEALADLVKTRFVFVSTRDGRLMQKMYRCGMVAIFRGPEGEVFDLALSAQALGTLSNRGSPTAAP
ncbi:MAG: hypothetical protein HN742_06065 [Lentisphaerae bacterium]|mgnify:CR=1 FL=1|jgi:hypothetical protein|nr:hypothetical protein [Lentisphaerota bacterium]MBT4819634.1 hypothetical protein [Lentisphaerota bacterium]MBT5609636.1 hypothetical protein [Lentisphaerota bacterium]MBT7055236.1 hypothetical protein [Lentisphaerota bacterium]MBT7841416.1 hypothetical protein [Lentisphaerota bacterium]